MPIDGLPSLYRMQNLDFWKLMVGCGCYASLYPLCWPWPHIYTENLPQAIIHHTTHVQCCMPLMWDTFVLNFLVSAICLVNFFLYHMIICSLVSTFAFLVLMLWETCCHMFFLFGICWPSFGSDLLLADLWELPSFDTGWSAQDARSSGPNGNMLGCQCSEINRVLTKGLM